MKRSGPPKRRTPLNVGTSRLRRSGRLRSRSAKRRQREEAAKAARRAVIVAAGGQCKISPVLQREANVWLVDTARHDPGCDYRLGVVSPTCSCRDLRSILAAHASCWRAGQACHERRKRSAGGSLVNPANLIPSCHACNEWVEREPDIAHRLGLVARPGDPDYDSLAAQPKENR